MTRANVGGTRAELASSRDYSLPERARETEYFTLVPELAVMTHGFARYG